MDKVKRVVIAAGGSGGHIYPGLALASAFTHLYPKVEVCFWGARGGMETWLIPQSGFSLKTVAIGRLQSNVSIFERLRTVFLLPLAILKACVFLMSYRPQKVIGVGGHASGPLLLASFLLRVSNAIWEPNAMPGLTNRWLSYFVQRSFVVFQSAQHHLKTSRTDCVGFPVRKEIESVKPLEHKSFHILVFGGSQGSVVINKVVKETFERETEELDGVRVTHQTGPKNFESLRDAYSKNPHVEVWAYLDPIEQFYSWADLVICRSGAGTLSELAACGLPSILIPLSSASDNHQQRNAQALQEAGAAAMVLQSELSGGVLKNIIIELKNDLKKRQEMSKNVRKFHRPQAAKDIVSMLCGQSEDKSTL